MKHFLLCSILLLLNIELKALPVILGEAEKADSILTLASDEILDVNPVRALELATEALSLSSNAGYSKGKAISSFYIGQVLSYLGDYEKSLKYLSDAENERYSRKNTVMRSEISRIKGQVYYLLNLDNASFSEFQKAYAYTTEIEDKAERDRYTGLAYENLGMAYHMIKNMPDSSLYWFKKKEKLLATMEESQTFKNRINLYTHYGEHYTDQQQYDTAVYYFNKAQSLILQYDYPYSSWLYQRWGDLHTKKNNPDSAMIYYQKGLDNLKSTNLKNELPALYKRISETYTKLGEEDSAKLYREKQLQLGTELGSARNVAAEEAFAMLLKEEQKLSQAKLQRYISMTVIFFVITLSVALVILLQSTRKRKKKESEVSELKQKLNDAFEEVVKLAKENDAAFLSRFREVYPEFTRNLINRHPDLTNSELRLIAMIFLDFRSKEIAASMFITHRSVQTNKSRLRKKLAIPSEIDLYRYFKLFS